jgi:transposase InsO family protein
MHLLTSPLLLNITGFEEVRFQPGLLAGGAAHSVVTRIRNLRRSRAELERVAPEIYDEERLHSSLDYRPPAAYEEALLAGHRIDLAPYLL